jgi:hypothetical protein
VTDLAQPPRVDFDEATHTYRVDGRLLPHVTEILQPLYNWEHVDPDVLDRKCALGRAVHRATELDDLGRLKESSLSAEVGGYLESWRKFRRDTGYTPILIEHKVVHKVMGFAGTLDRETVEYVDDLKAGVESPAHGVQVAAYAMARASETREPYKKRRAIYLDPDGRYPKVRPFTDIGDYPTFVGLLAIYNWRRKHGRN